MPDTKFDAGAYWKDRLGRQFDLTGVGYRRRSAAFNRWVYRVRTELLDELFEQNGWPLEGRAILDVGCGTGYFIDHWLRRKARPIVGIDVTEVSVQTLAQRFPEARFQLADLGEPNLAVDGQYEYISVFDVLYHIVDDRRFEQAVANLSRLSHAGSKVIITDLFGNSSVKGKKHVRNRSLDCYTEVFAKKGFRLLEIRPLFFTLMPPGRLAGWLGYWVGSLGWEVLTMPARWERLGQLWGRLLYKVDSNLRRRFDRGPSHHLAVFEYVGIGETRG
jgi:SAM-dependent methyltransferase